MSEKTVVGALLKLDQAQRAEAEILIDRISFDEDALRDFVFAAIYYRAKHETELALTRAQLLGMEKINAELREELAWTNTVMCEKCVFRYGAEHKLADGSYSCPVCELTQAQARCAEVEKAAAEFIVRHDVIAPALKDVFTFYAVHGMKWPEADNWKRELDALRDALKG